MHFGETIRHGIQWVFFGKVGTQVLHLVFTIVLARLLMPEDFGLLVTVQIFTGTAMLVSGGGMGQALVQTKTLGEHDSHVVFTAQLVIGVALYALFFFLAPWFAHWFNEPLYTNLLRVSALTFLVRPLSNVPSSLLKREMRFKAKAIIGAIAMVLTGASSIAMALTGFGVWSLVLGGMVGSVASMVMMIGVSGWRPRITIDKAVLKPLAGYGVQVSINDVIRHLIRHTTNFIISRFMGAAAVGIFNKSDSLREAPESLVGGSAYNVVFRALSKTQENIDQSRYIYLRTITLVALYALPFYVGFLWVAEPFIVTIYGAHWREAAVPLSILALGGLFTILYRQAMAVSAARKLLGREMIIHVVSWFVLVASVASGFQWGLTGIAWGVLFATSFMALWMTQLAARELNLALRDYWRALRPVILLNTILAVSLWTVDVMLFERYAHMHAVYLFGMAAFGGAVYALCFLYLPLSSLNSLSKEAQRWKNRLHLPGARPMNET